MSEPARSLGRLLHGERVRLTAMTRQDLGAIAGWQQDAEFLRLFDAVPSFSKTEDQLVSWLEQQQKSSEDFLFAIRPLDGDDLLGFLTVGEILWSQGIGWLSIAIGAPAQHGRGYGSEAMRLALRFGFHELNLRRLQLTVFSYNQRAIALYEKLGFQREGTFREFLVRDGQTHDMYLYGLLRREWEATALTNGAP